MKAILLYEVTSIVYNRCIIIIILIISTGGVVVRCRGVLLNASGNSHTVFSEVKPVAQVVGVQFWLPGDI